MMTRGLQIGVGTILIARYVESMCHALCVLSFSTNLINPIYSAKKNAFFVKMLLSWACVSVATQIQGGLFGDTGLFDHW